YAEPQWHLLNLNSSVNVSELQTEGCVDGWRFDQSEFSATTVSEWDLVCSLRPLKQMIQTIYMGGVLTGAIIYGGLSDRWYAESARWLVLNRQSEEALKSLHRVARINRKPEIINKLTLEVLHSHMSKEIESSRSSFTAFNLLKTSQIRRISICLMAVWSETYLHLVLFISVVVSVHVISPMQVFKYLPVCRFSTSFAYYGLAMDLQKFGVSPLINAHQAILSPVYLCSGFIPCFWHLMGCPVLNCVLIGCGSFQVSIYLMQIIFGAVDIPAKFLALGVLSYLGRRVCQVSCLFLSAVIIFANIFVPTGTVILVLVLVLM
ncbi:hypothetical protein GOODEAATRI_023537, partial [Goodea atripinnis]